MNVKGGKGEAALLRQEIPPVKSKVNLVDV